MIRRPITALASFDKEPDVSFTSRELQSTIGANHSLTLSLAAQPVGEPGDDEAIVRIEAAPLNPSDIGLMLGPAEISTIRADGERARLRCADGRT